MGHILQSGTDMPRTASLTRQRILDAAYVEFRRKGFHRVGIDEIAAAAGITKRTLYHHFRSKDTLITAVLEAQHELSFAAFQTISEQLSGSPEDIVSALFAELVTWSQAPRWSGSGYTRIAIELADLPGHPARAIASRHKEKLEGHLAELFARAHVHSPRARAREVWLLAEGAMALIVIHGDRDYARAAAEAAKALLKCERSPRRHNRGRDRT
jgi:AcrR family transcriptional regulator